MKNYKFQAIDKICGVLMLGDNDIKYFELGNKNSKLVNTVVSKNTLIDLLEVTDENQSFYIRPVLIKSDKLYNALVNAYIAIVELDPIMENTKFINQLQDYFTQYLKETTGYNNELSLYDIIELDKDINNELTQDLTDGFLNYLTENDEQIYNIIYNSDNDSEDVEA